MAERGVRYFIRYVMDKASLAASKTAARKGGQESGEALARGADSALAKLRNTIVGTFAVTKLAGWGKALIGLGVAGAETGSKFGATFGAATGTMDKFLDRIGRAAGLSRNMGRDIASDMGAMVQGMGFSRAESAKLSQQMLATAADLTSFANVPIERSTHAISSALAGEREQLKMLIGPVSQAAVDTRALAMAQARGSTEATEQEKALATLAIVQEKMGVRTGDLDRTFDSQANTARRLGGELRTLAETLGAVLVSGNPATDVMSSLSKATETATKWVTENGHAIAAWARVVVVAAKAAFQSIVTPIKWLFNAGEVIGGVLQQIAEQIEFHLGGALNKVIAAWNEIAPGNVLDIGFTINTKTPAEHQAEMNRLGQGIRRDMLDAGEAINDLGKSYEALAFAATDAMLAVGGVSMAVKDPGLSEDRGGLTAEQRLMLSRGAPALTKGQLMDRMAGTAQSLTKEGRLRGSAPEGAKDAHALENPVFDALDAEVRRLQGWRDELDKTRESAAAMGEGIAMSFETFFSTLAEGGSKLKGVVGLVRNVASQTLAALVKGKVEYHMAEGTGKLASGTWPPNPMAILSAMKHFAAAALFRAIPGIVAGGSGGGSSFSAGGSVASGQGVPSTKPSGPDIIIRIDGVDPSNPRHQTALGQAQRQYQERWGGRIRTDSGRG